MINLLSDPPTFIYGILTIFTLVGAKLAIKERQPRFIILFVGSGFLLLGLFLCDKCFDSPRKQSIRKMKLIQDASVAKDWDRAFEHISNSFLYDGASGQVNLSKKDLRGKLRVFEPMLEKGLVFREFDRSDFNEVSNKKIEMGFYATIAGRPETDRYVVVVFVEDPDGEWRLQNFMAVRVAEGANPQREDIPGLD